MLTKREITEILHEKYPHLADEYSVKQIGLFGSYAKDVAQKTSDIDLIVEFERPIGFKFIELTEYLETILGQKVDVLTPAGLEGIRNASIAKNIKESIEYVISNR